MVAPEIWSQYDAILLKGALADTGMGSFKDLLSDDDVAAIRAYALLQAQALYGAKHPPAPDTPTPARPTH